MKPRKCILEYLTVVDYISHHLLPSKAGSQNRHFIVTKYREHGFTTPLDKPQAHSSIIIVSKSACGIRGGIEHDFCIDDVKRHDGRNGNALLH